MTWLLKILEKMSPEIVTAFREMLDVGLNELYKKAVADKRSKWDDRGVEMIAAVFGVELEK